MSLEGRASGSWGLHCPRSSGDMLKSSDVAVTNNFEDGCHEDIRSTLYEFGHW